MYAEIYVLEKNRVVMAVVPHRSYDFPRRAWWISLFRHSRRDRNLTPGSTKFPDEAIPHSIPFRAVAKSLDKRGMSGCAKPPKGGTPKHVMLRYSEASLPTR